MYYSINFNEIEFLVYSLIKIFKLPANNVAITNIINIVFNYVYIYIYCGLIKWKIENYVRIISKE